MRLADVLMCLDAEMARVSLDALAQVTEPSEFGYGRAVGTYGGLQLAKTSIMAFYADAEAKDRDL